MASTLVTFDFALKKRFDKRKVELIMFSDRPLMGKMPKDTEFQGSGQKIPLAYVAPQGIASTSRTIAQTNATNLVGVAFDVTAGDLKGSVFIGDKVIEASRSNVGAFLQNKAIEVEGLHETMADQLAVAVVGNGGQSLGRSTATPIANVVILTNPADAHKFEIGEAVVASANDGSAVAHTLLAGGPVLVTAVNRNTGTVTLASSPAAWVNQFYLFREDTFYGNTAKIICFGVTAYIWGDDSPPVLYGVTRTPDVQRLAGGRVPDADLVGKSIEERLQIMLSYQTGRWKGPGGDEVYLHPENWQTLAIALQSRGQRALDDESTSFGYKYLEVIGGGKTAKVFSDRYVPFGTALSLNMKSWTLLSMRELIHPLNGDGFTMLRKSDADDYELRLVSYPGVGNNAPGRSSRCAVA